MMRKHLNLLFGGVMLLAISACNKASDSKTDINQLALPANVSNNLPAAGYQTLFSTNFDGSSTQIVHKCTPCSTDLYQGTDWTTAGNQLLFGSKSTIEYQLYNAGDVDRQAKITTANGAANTSVLNFRITTADIPDNYGGVDPHKGRVQHQLIDYLAPDGYSLKQFYQKVSIMLNYDSFHAIEQNTTALTKSSHDWMTLFEEFNGIASADLGNSSYTNAAHRVSVGLIKDPANSQRLIVSADSQQWDPATGKWSGTVDSNLFSYTLPSVRIIPGVWYTFEIYMLEGGGGNTNQPKGAFWLRVTNQSTPSATGEIGSKTPLDANRTQSTHDISGNGFHIIYPMKFYTSGDVIAASQNNTNNPNHVPSQIYFDNYVLGNIAP